jgi:hypothetical protein
MAMPADSDSEFPDREFRIASIELLSYDDYAALRKDDSVDITIRPTLSARFNSMGTALKSSRGRPTTTTTSSTTTTTTTKNLPPPQRSRVEYVDEDEDEDEEEEQRLKARRAEEIRLMPPPPPSIPRRAPPARTAAPIPPTVATTTTTTTSSSSSVQPSATWQRYIQQYEASKFSDVAGYKATTLETRIQVFLQTSDMNVVANELKSINNFVAIVFRRGYYFRKHLLNSTDEFISDVGALSVADGNVVEILSGLTAQQGKLNGSVSADQQHITYTLLPCDTPDDEVREYILGGLVFSPPSTTLLSGLLVTARGRSGSINQIRHRTFNCMGFFNPANRQLRLPTAFIYERYIDMFVANPEVWLRLFWAVLVSQDHTIGQTLQHFRKQCINLLLQALLSNFVRLRSEESVQTAQIENDVLRARVNNPNTPTELKKLLLNPNSTEIIPRLKAMASSLFHDGVYASVRAAVQFDRDASFGNLPSEPVYSEPFGNEAGNIQRFTMTEGTAEVHSPTLRVFLTAGGLMIPLYAISNYPEADTQNPDSPIPMRACDAQGIINVTTLKSGIRQYPETYEFKLVAYPPPVKRYGGDVIMPGEEPEPEYEDEHGEIDNMSSVITANKVGMDTTQYHASIDWIKNVDMRLTLTVDRPDLRKPNYVPEKPDYVLKYTLSFPRAHNYFSQWLIGMQLRMRYAIGNILMAHSNARSEAKDLAVWLGKAITKNSSVSDRARVRDICGIAYLCARAQAGSMLEYNNIV